MIREREITVNGMKFQAQLHYEFILVAVKIDDIAFITKCAFDGVNALEDKVKIFDSNRPEEIAAAESIRLKPLLTVCGA